MVCKDLCRNYKANKILHIGRYDSGQKRCHHCEIYIKWDGKYCPCCGLKLRSKPRGRAKTKYNIRVNLDENRYGL